MELNKTDLYKSIFRITVFLPLIVSIATCASLNIYLIAAAFIIACFIFKAENFTSLFYVFSSFTVIYQATEIINPLLLSAAITVGYILFAFLRNKKRLALKPEFISVIMMSTAITVTVLITTQYFGIGATGFTNIDIIRNYISLGFHPNWRGILYGTIVMVIMITYPRKFKKLSKIVSPLFVALLATFSLNFILIPKGTVSPVQTVSFSKFDISQITAFAGNTVQIKEIIYALFVAFFVFVISSTLYSENKTEDVKSGIASAITGLICGYPVSGNINKKSNDFITGILSAVIIILILLLTKGFETLPVSSCAVIMIVGAWQAINKKYLKDTFACKSDVVLFIVLTVITFLTNITVGLAVTFAVNYFKKNK